MQWASQVFHGQPTNFFLEGLNCCFIRSWSGTQSAGKCPSVVSVCHVQHLFGCAVLLKGTTCGHRCTFIAVRTVGCGAAVQKPTTIGNLVSFNRSLSLHKRNWTNGAIHFKQQCHNGLTAGWPCDKIGNYHISSFEGRVIKWKKRQWGQSDCVLKHFRVEKG